MSNIEQVEDNLSFMKDFKPLTDDQKEILFDAVGEMKEAGPLGEADYTKYNEISSNGIPVGAILDAYNSCMIQADPSFAAENN